MLDKEIQTRKKIKRRKFFSNAGKGIFGFYLLNLFPFKIFVDKSKKEKSITVKIHPSAIQRNNRGIGK